MESGRSLRFKITALSVPRSDARPNYALKRTVRSEVSGAIMRCGRHGRVAWALTLIGGQTVSREDIVAIASRLFAMFLALTAIRVAATSLGIILPGHTDWTAVLYPLLAVFICIVPALLLWYFPRRIARMLLPVMRDSGPPITASGGHIQAIALTILGAWILAQSISDATYWVALVKFMSASQYSAVGLSSTQKASIARNVTEFALGVALLLGSGGLSTMLHRLRYGSLRPQEPAE